MSTGVNELAIATRTDSGQSLALWLSVYRFVAQQTNRFTAGANQREKGSRLFDLDDLTQAGFLAVMDAVTGYDPDTGAAFTTYLVYHLRRRFAEVAGIRGTKLRPERHASSLDAPVDTDGDMTPVDHLADPDAERAYDDLVERDANRQACAELLAAAQLDDDAIRVIELTVCQNISIQTAAVIMHTTPEQVRAQRTRAIRKLSYTPVASRMAREFHR